MKHVRTFDFDQYSEITKTVLITKAQKNSNNEAHFHITEIVPFAHFNNDYANEFAEWLKRKNWVDKVLVYGTDNFICKVNSAFLQISLNQKLFGNMKGETQ